MRVALITTSDSSGGAAIAAMRMADALESIGHSVSILVLIKKRSDDRVHKVSSKGDKEIFILQAIQYQFEKRILVRSNYQFSGDPWLGNNIANHQTVLNADVIQFHWINHGFLSIHNLKAIFSLKKPVFWHMHDYWPFTGGCHYPSSCERFKIGCGNCPALTFSSSSDRSSRYFNQKIELFQINKPTLVGASLWLSEEAKKSKLGRWARVVHIPNPIDIKFYQNTNTKDLRAELGIPIAAKVVLFAAMNVNDVRKGFLELLKALQILKNKTGHLIHVLVAGKVNTSLDLPFQTHYLGFANQSRMLSAYKAADVFVIPSLEENLPNTILESLACGTPVAGFKVGGIPELVTERSGFLADYKDVQQLADCIENSLNIKSTGRFDCNLERFSYIEVAETYDKLFRETANV